MSFVVFFVSLSLCPHTIQIGRQKKTARMRRVLPCASTFRVDNSGGDGKRYQFIMWLTALFCVVELVVALLSNSLALLSDAFHNLGDVGMWHSYDWTAISFL
jgi:Co/Zn/Cd efflux system component